MRTIRVALLGIACLLPGCGNAPAGHMAELIVAPLPTEGPGRKRAWVSARLSQPATPFQMVMAVKQAIPDFCRDLGEFDVVETAQQQEERLAAFQRGETVQRGAQIPAGDVWHAEAVCEGHLPNETWLDGDDSDTLYRDGAELATERFEQIYPDTEGFPTVFFGTDLYHDRHAAYAQAIGNAVRKYEKVCGGQGVIEIGPRVAVVHRKTFAPPRWLRAAQFGFDHEKRPAEALTVWVAMAVSCSEYPARGEAAHLDAPPPSRVTPIRQPAP